MQEILSQNWEMSSFELNYLFIFNSLSQSPPETRFFLIYFNSNKTGLQPVPRSGEEVPLFWGLGLSSNPIWCQGCPERQIGMEEPLALLETYFVL